jgi:hypothetical protein
MQLLIPDLVVAILRVLEELGRGDMTARAGKYLALGRNDNEVRNCFVL